MLYGQSAACRWQLIHDYFGEPFEQGACGNCDNCTSPLEQQLGVNDRQDERASGGGDSRAANAKTENAGTGKQANGRAEKAAGGGAAKAESAGEAKGKAAPDVRGAREFAAGDEVRVPVHGAGRVVAVEGDKLVVSFPDGETRKFKQDFVE